jgi:exopolysaccharide biosynthesis polyprenyl glycosylphosphotransferase
MLRQRGWMIGFWFMVGDAIASVAAFLCAYYVAGVALNHYCPQTFTTILKIRSYLWIAGLGVPLWWFLLFLFGEYDYHRLLQQRSILSGLWRPMLVAILVVSAAIFMAQEKYFARRVIFSFLALNVGFIALARYIIMCASAVAGGGGRSSANLLLIGSPVNARAFLSSIVRDRWGLNVVGFLSDADVSSGGELKRLGRVADLARLLASEVIDAVVVVEPEGGLAGINKVIQTCEEVGVRVHIQANCFQAALSRPHFDDFRGVRFLTFSAGPYDPFRLAVKRAIDMVGAVVLLVALSWLFVIIAIIIRISSGNGVIFSQMRSGLNGRQFTLYKFRSMVRGASDDTSGVAELNVMSGPVFKANPDPRITKWGKLLRRYSLDELPQLWNVLRGDMSLVGPRPALPGEVVKYERWHRRRLSMRPGMTGLWQTSGRNSVDFSEWMRLDLEYIDRWSLGLDLKLLLKTIPEIIRGGGL